MAANLGVAIEVLNSSNSWVDITTDVQHCQISGGLPQPRAIYPQVGRCALDIVNSGSTYTPDANGTGSALIRARRRCRVKITGANLGKALQVQHTGNSGLGGATTITATGSSYSVGFNGTDIWVAQSFLVTAGQLTQFTVKWGANVGSPTGTVTWEIRTDAGGTSGPTNTVLATGTFTPTPSGTDTINVGSGPALLANTKYWLMLRTTNVQTNGNWFAWQTQGSSVYASGNVAWSFNSSTSWVDDPVSDVQCSITTSLISTYFSQTVSQTINNGDVWTLAWEARATFDSQYNVDTVRVITNAENGAFSSYSYTNKWVARTLTFTATAGGISITPQFFNQGNGSPGNAAVIEYRKITLKKGAGADILTNGNFATGSASPWAATNASLGTDTLTVINDYWIRFNGFIDEVNPATAAKAGDQITRAREIDWVDIMRTQTIDVALQKNQRGDQLVQTVLNLLPAGKLNTTMPGTLLDTGRGLFQRAFDGYTKGVTTILDAIRDASLSEYGFYWQDFDGTARWASRDFRAKRVTTPAALTISDGMPFAIVPVQSAANIINKTNIKYIPRQTVPNQVIGRMNSYITIPGQNADHTPGSVTVTLTYRDPNGTGRAIGGDNVITPVVNVDYSIYDQPNPTATFGVNYTSPVNIMPTPTFVISASQITATFTNPYVGPTYVTAINVSDCFHVRGDAVYTYDPVIVTQSDPTLTDNDLIREWTWQMPFTDDGPFVQSFAHYIVNRFKNPFVEVQQIIADSEQQLNGTDLAGLEIGDVVVISDTKAGLSNLRHMVIGAIYDLNPKAANAVQRITLLTERLDDTTYWLLGDATYGVLGTSTRLYI